MKDESLKYFVLFLMISSFGISKCNIFSLQNFEEKLSNNLKDSHLISGRKKLHIEDDDFVEAAIPTTKVVKSQTKDKSLIKLDSNQTNNSNKVKSSMIVDSNKNHLKSTSKRSTIKIEDDNEDINNLEPGVLIESDKNVQLAKKPNKISKKYNPHDKSATISNKNKTVPIDDNKNIEADQGNAKSSKNYIRKLNLDKVTKVKLQKKMKNTISISKKIESDEENEVRNLFKNYNSIENKEEIKNQLLIKNKSLVNSINLSGEDVYNIINLFKDKDLFNQSPISARNIIRRILKDEGYHSFAEKFKKEEKKIKEESTKKFNFFDSNSKSEEEELRQKVKYLKNSISSSYFDDAFGYIGRKGILTFVNNEFITEYWCILNSKVFACYDFHNNSNVEILMRLFNMKILHDLFNPCFALNDKVFCSLNSYEANIWVDSISYLQNLVNNK